MAALHIRDCAEQAHELVKHLTQGTGTLAVVDVDVLPERADSAGIILTPTLVRYWPLPVARLHGHLDDESQARRVLGTLLPSAAPDAAHSPRASARAVQLGTAGT